MRSTPRNILRRVAADSRADSRPRPACTRRVRESGEADPSKVWGTNSGYGVLNPAGLGVPSWVW